MALGRIRLGPRWLLLWTLAFAVAETLGLGIAGGVVASGHAGTGETSLIGAMAIGILAGAIEGAIVGAVLGMVLVVVRPALRMRAWIPGTMAGAALAWCAGSAVPVVMADAGDAGTEPAFALQMVFASGLGLAAGLVLAAFQAPALRAIGVRRHQWLIANAIGWALAMPLAFLAADRPWTDAAALARGTALIALMGAVVGLATGLALRRVGQARASWQPLRAS